MDLKIGEDIGPDVLRSRVILHESGEKLVGDIVFLVDIVVTIGQGDNVGVCGILLQERREYIRHERHPIRIGKNVLVIEQLGDLLNLVAFVQFGRGEAFERPLGKEAVHALRAVHIRQEEVESVALGAFRGAVAQGEGFINIAHQVIEVGDEVDGAGVVRTLFIKGFCNLEGLLVLLLAGVYGYSPNLDLVLDFWVFGLDCLGLLESLLVTLDVD